MCVPVDVFAGRGQSALVSVRIYGMLSCCHMKEGKWKWECCHVHSG